MKGICVKCKKEGKGRAQHHVTYYPEEISLLCFRCHKKITELNTAVSSILGNRKLTTKNRLFLWNMFIENGEISKAEVKKAKAEQAIRELYGLDKIYDGRSSLDRQIERGGRKDSPLCFS